VGRVAFVLLAGSLVALVSGPGRASLYTPDELRFTVPVGEDGKARPLRPDEFRTALAVLMNAVDTKVPADREVFLKRIERAKGKKLSPPETAALAADLLRVGRADEALNALAPRLRDRVPDYFVYTTYANIRAMAGDWAEALRYHQSAQFDSEMPVEVKGLSKAQRDWWERLDRDYVPHYYRLRLKEADQRRDRSRSEQEKLDENEDVFPLFPVPDRAHPNPQPVRFVNEAGEYQPGTLAAVERAKLPPDAIPIVQQLLLWFPNENRLYWLLAELYAAEGDFAASFGSFHSIAWGRAYGNRKVFMDHRQAVEAALNSQPRKASADEPLLSTPTEPAAPAEPTEKAPISMRTIWIYFGIVGVIALFAFIRAMSRRARGDCGPAG
jgi:tetratricopeptide (TPR) repeat protein